MCAWLNTTASTCWGSNGKQQLRWMDSSRRPWNKPHSSNNRLPLTSKRYIEPVVVRVAPKQWICMGQSCCALRVTSRKWLRLWLPAQIFQPKTKIQDPTALRRRDSAARRSPMAEIRNANTRANEIFPPSFCFPAWDFGLLSGLAVPVRDARLVQIVG